MWKNIHMSKSTEANHSGPPVFEPETAPDNGFGVEKYEGDHTYVKGMWPGDKIPLTEHAHVAPCGGYFNHKHPDGDKRHSHTHIECGWCERNRV